MRVQNALLLLIVELFVGCKREKQINYIAIPITPVTALLAQDMAKPEQAHKTPAIYFTSKVIDFSPTLPLRSTPCIIATYFPLRSDVKKLNSVLP
jgi:hypothetical protein